MIALALCWCLAGLPAADRAAEVEADWLVQEQLRAQPGTIDPAADAAGAVDGIKDGKWGFHTSGAEVPWWQVDLGEARRLDRVAIYNRADGAADRARELRLLLSDDGREFREVYHHDGTVFYGANDGKPLVVPLPGASARYVRCALPQAGYFHLDEVEVYGPDGDGNLALGRPALQSSVSQWSTRHRPPGVTVEYDLGATLARGRGLAADLRRRGIDPTEAEREFAAAEAAGDAAAAYRRARWAARRLALADPLLGFDRILFVKRAPGQFTHMSDQNYGWWSRPGGGIYLLSGFREDAPRVECLTSNFAEGSFLSPELSPDGSRVLFAWCRYHPEVAGLRDKQTKANVPEDAFYHLFEMNLDGTGLRQLTFGRYDDFDARYLPTGEIVFLSTRRGTFTQCGPSAELTLGGLFGDSYVRCGGDPWRPVAVYTLHVMTPDGRGVRAISPFENFEWTPAVAPDGRVIYARWDYIDRDNMPYMSLWSANPDGSNPQAVYGNYTRSPHCIFEARAVPGSRKLIFTASGHHSITGGSLVLLDPARGLDGPECLTRLTPEVCFPEIEGWPDSYYASPWPLDERHYLCAWSNQPLGAQGALNPVNAQGLYYYDAWGNLELLYRDEAISSLCPIPVRSTPAAAPRIDLVSHPELPDARMLVLDVYRGLPESLRGRVRALRIVALPAKVQPVMNSPQLGVTGDDPGKCVLGTVPIEADGSAFFRVPAGVGFFIQALDADGRAVQTMRSATSAQAGATISCGGCHEPRNQAPANLRPAALGREPSRLEPGPEGSWPLRFDRLVQPVLEARCVACHAAGATAPELSAAASWQSLVTYGQPSLRDYIGARYRDGRSPAGEGPALASPLLRLLALGHHDVALTPEETARLVVWLDTYGQRQGSYSLEQEQELHDLRSRWAGLLRPPM